MKTLSALLLASSLAIAAQAGAASLTIVTSTPQVAVGQTVTFMVQGSGFTDLTSGGDFSVSWNPSALQFVGPVVIAPVAASNPPPSAAAQFDTLSVDTTSSAQGLLKRLDIFKASGSDPNNTANPTGSIGPDLSVVNLSFLVLDGLLSLPNRTSVVQVGADQTTFALGWFKPDAITSYALTYGSASVSAVPAPPAVWLLATGVAGLVARRFRKAA